MTSTIEAVYPLSPMQHGLLFHALQAPGRAFYVQQNCRLIEGDLDPRAFERAWRAAIARHDVLRTAFEWEHLNGKARQIVLREVELPFDVLDWSTLDPAAQTARRRACLDEQRRAVLDLARPPLMRLTLARTGGRTHWFLWTWHHILMDGWSSTLLLNEVAALYSAFAAGQELALPRPAPFRSYIAWLQRQHAPAAEAFWRGQLAGLTEPTPLPGAQRSRVGRVDTGARCERGVRLPPPATAHFTRFARRRRLTPSAVVHGAWAMLLGRYSMRSDIVFGTTVSGRPADLPGVETMVGLFINTLPLRLRIEHGDTIGGWLARLQAAQIDASQYAYAPLAEIQRWSDLPPATPAFESVVVFENYPVDAFHDHYGLETGARRMQHGLRTTAAEDIETTHYPLLLVVNAGAELRLRLIFDPATFEEAEIDRLLGQLLDLVEAMGTDEERCVRELCAPPAKERARALRRTAGPVVRPLAPPLVQGLFLRRAAETPDAIAVVDGPRRLSYGEVDRHSSRLARWLASRGIGPDVRVGLLLPPGADLVVGLIAVIKAGAAYVPLDPQYPAERLAHMLADTRPALILTTRALAGRVPACEAPRVAIDEAAEAAADLDDGPIEGLGDPDHAVYVMYTSGSTGRPKGVVLTHRCLANLLQWHHDALGGEAAVLHYASLSFDVSFHEVFAALSCGGTIVPVPDETRLSAAAIAALIHHRGVGKATVPLVLLERLAAAHADDARQLASLRHVIATGELLRISPALKQLFAHLPECRLHNHYGPSETHLATVHTLSADAASWPELPPIGRPIANARTYVLDSALDVMPIGGTGELYVGGAAIARGYWARPALTAEKFLPDPFSPQPGARMYRTGDLAHLDDAGDLHYHGRTDRQVKVRGVRVEPAEIESALATHPAVRHATVAVTTADGYPELVACVVADGAVDAAALRAHLLQRLPPAMIPAHVAFVSEIPLSPNGKVDLARLPPRHGGRARVEPEGPTEQLVASVWDEVLGRAVSATDDFFESGGHSLHAMQVISRLREVFSDEVPVAWMFEHPTPRLLAAAIANLLGGRAIADRVAELWLQIRDLPDAEVAAQAAGRVD